MTRTMTIMLAGVALPLLAGCGANEIASPGGSGPITINPAPTPAPSPTPTPTPAGTVIPAASCPTLPAGANPLVDRGVVATNVSTVSWRVCELPAMVNQSITLPKITGLVYQMAGRVNVGCDGGFTAPTQAAPRTSPTVGCATPNLTADTNVTLTIEPGVVVVAGTGTSWLAVNRGNKINATGTVARPIIFTSIQNLRGETTDASMQQWGGVVLMGRARTTDCRNGTVVANNCERETEGSADPAGYGGTDETYNAGTMRYVQIRYSGFAIAPNNELQALTTESVGSGTTLEYIQSHNSSDDGAEFFGGTVRLKRFIVTGADDDSMDVDTGADAAFQHVLVVQRPGEGDSLMEIDSNNNENDIRRTKFKLANFTVIQPLASGNNNGSGNLASVMLRGDSDTSWVNGVIISPNNECLRMNGSGSTALRATLVARSVVMQCSGTGAAKYLGTGTAGSGGYTAADVQAIFGSGSNGNNEAFTPSLTSLFVNGANETAVPATDPRTIDTFFDATAYVGAVRDGNDNWYKGWTCNSGYAPFDDTLNANRSCNSIPTT